MKKLLLLIFLLFASLQNFSQCGGIASFTYSINGNTVTFISNSVADSGYTITGYYWEFGEGEIASGDSVVYTYDGICYNGYACLQLEIDNNYEYCENLYYCAEIDLGVTSLETSVSYVVDSSLQTVTLSPTISGGYPPYNYYWYFNGESIYSSTLTIPTNDSILYLSAYLEVTDNNDCADNAQFGIWNPFVNCTLDLEVTVDENLITALPFLSLNYDLGGEWGGYFQVLGEDNSEYYYGGGNNGYTTYLDTVGSHEICFYLDPYTLEDIPQCPTQACQTFEVTSIDQDCNAEIGYSIYYNVVNFSNNSTGYYNDFVWNFDDGETSESSTVSHQFSPGLHTTILAVFNTETNCISSDTVTFTIGEPAHLCGYVFFDNNANGTFDSEETLVDSISMFAGNTYFSSDTSGFDVYIQGGQICVSLIEYSYDYEITTPALDPDCELGGILLNILPGEELCPLYIGILVQPATVCGTMYFDGNNNGIFDSGESPLPFENITAIISSDNIFTVATDVNGNYCIDALVGNNVALVASFSINPQASIEPYGYNYYINADSYTSNFGVYYVENNLDLGIDLTESGSCTRGFEGYYNLYAHNYSNLSSTATITFQYNNQQSYVYSSPDGLNDDVLNTFTWDVLMEPFSVQVLTLGVMNSEDMVLGSTIFLEATIEETGSDPDVLAENNNSFVSQIVVGSYDPNNKVVSPAGDPEQGGIPYQSFQDLFGYDEVTYTINFQNTGTAPAVNVLVTDEIDVDLDISTIQLIGTTHNAMMTIQDRMVTWTFNNIQLPDSNTNEPESHGAITYRISFLDALEEGTEITNTANIYFDFNEPIVTNTTLNTLYYPVGLNENMINNNVRIYPNPTNNLVNIEVGEISEIKIYDTQSRLINSFVISDHSRSLDISEWAAGMYVVKVINHKTSSAYTLLKN